VRELSRRRAAACIGVRASLPPWRPTSGALCAATAQLPRQRAPLGASGAERAAAACRAVANPRVFRLLTRSAAGTHLRAKSKREEMTNALRKMRCAGDAASGCTVVRRPALRHRWLPPLSAATTHPASRLQRCWAGGEEVQVRALAIGGAFHDLITDALLPLSGRSSRKASKLYRVYSTLVGHTADCRLTALRASWSRPPTPHLLRPPAAPPAAAAAATARASSSSA